MPKCKLSRTAVAAFPASPHKPTFYYDTGTKGFGVRVGGRSKSYFVERRPTGFESRVRVTLGTVADLSLEQARALAEVFIANMVGGGKPLSPAKAARTKKRADAVAAAEAEAEASALAEVEAARRAAVPTLRRALDDYLAFHTLRPITAANYRQDFRLHFADWLDLPASDITRNMIEARYQALCSRVLLDCRGKPRKAADGREIMGGATSASRAFRYLRAVFAYAVERYRTADGTAMIATGNPVLCLSALRAWKPTARRTRVIPVAKFGALLDALEPTQAAVPRDAHRAAVRDAFLLAVFTGARRREVLTLEWRDVDLATSVLTFRVTKNGKDHVVPFGETVAAMLKRRQREAVAGARLVFPANTKSGHVVSVAKPLAEVCKSVGAIFSFHDARRTLITIAVEYLDIDRPSVKALVNHASGDVTDGYSIRQIETARRRMLAIERFMLTAAGRLPSADVHQLHPADDQGQANPAAA